MPHLPDHNVETLVKSFGLTYKDALTLLSLDNGERYEYFLQTMESLRGGMEQKTESFPQTDFGRLAGNWCVLTVHY